MARRLTLPAVLLAGTLLAGCSGVDQSAPDRTAEALLHALGDEEYEKACRLYAPEELASMGLENCLQLAAATRGLVGGSLASSAEVSGYQQDGDRAFVGSDNVRINGQQTFVPLRFLRIDGQWYLTDELFSVNE